MKWNLSVESDSWWPHGLCLPGSSIHGIFQARILEWVAISFSRGSSRPRDWTQVSHILGRRFTVWATKGSSHCCALLLRILLLGNRSLVSASMGPTHRQPTINEVPTGTCPPQLLVSTTVSPATDNYQWGAMGKVIQSRISRVRWLVVSWLLPLNNLQFFTIMRIHFW